MIVAVVLGALNLCAANGCGDDDASAAKGNKGDPDAGGQSGTAGANGSHASHDAAAGDENGNAQDNSNEASGGAGGEDHTPSHDAGTSAANADDTTPGEAGAGGAGDEPAPDEEAGSGGSDADEGGSGGASANDCELMNFEPEAGFERCFACMQEQCCAEISACDQDPTCVICEDDPLNNVDICIDSHTFERYALAQAVADCQTARCVPPCGAQGGSSCTPDDCVQSCPNYSSNCQ